MMAIALEIAMAKKAADWEARAKGLLKSELKRRNVTYSELVEKLERFGVTEKEENIRNKLSRGKFAAVFFLQCMEAIGATSIHFDYGEP